MSSHVIKSFTFLGKSSLIAIKIDFRDFLKLKLKIVI